MKFNKKVLSIFIIALFAVILVACTDKTTQLPTTEPTTTVPTTSAPTTLPPTTVPYDFTTVVAALKAHYSDTLDSDEFVATSNLDLITSLQDLTISWSSRSENCGRINESRELSSGSTPAEALQQPVKASKGSCAFSLQKNLWSYRSVPWQPAAVTGSQPLGRGYLLKQPP